MSGKAQPFGTVFSSVKVQPMTKYLVLASAGREAYAGRGLRRSSSLHRCASTLSAEAAGCTTETGPMGPHIFYFLKFCESS